MRTGNYVTQLHGDLQYKAFVPKPLPFEIQMDADLESLLSKADYALGRLDSVANMLPHVDFFILMYVRKEATLSSQIEGTRATFEDVIKAGARIKDAEIHKDVDEVLNYITAMNYGIDRLKKLPLSLRLIREIHEKLLQGVRGEHKHPGEFRISQNWVGGASLQTAAFIPPPPTEVMRLMGNLEGYLHNTSPVPILIKTGLLHAQFETIHPFLDGNGRVGRLLIAFYLYQQGLLRKPLLYVSDFFKTYRQAYYDKLNNFREKGDIEGWLKFFLEGITTTSNKAVETTRKIIKLRENDVAKVAVLGRSLKKGMLLLNSLYRTPIVKVKDVERITSLSNPNALTLVSKFVSLGILKETTGYKRNRIYSYSDYIALFS